MVQTVHVENKLQNKIDMQISNVHCTVTQSDSSTKDIR